MCLALYREDNVIYCSVYLLALFLPVLHRPLTLLNLGLLQVRLLHGAHQSLHVQTSERFHAHRWAVPRMPTEATRQVLPQHLSIERPYEWTVKTYINVSRYFKTCLIRHLSNPFQCVIPSKLWFPNDYFVWVLQMSYSTPCLFQHQISLPVHVKLDRL